MTSCIIASLIASRLEPESIYTMKRTRPASAPGRDTLELVPGPDTVIQRGDRVVIVARQEDLDRLRTL